MEDGRWEQVEQMPLVEEDERGPLPHTLIVLFSAAIVLFQWALTLGGDETLRHEQSASVLLIVKFEIQCSYRITSENSREMTVVWMLFSGNERRKDVFIDV